jgi:hypothetical protein
MNTRYYHTPLKAASSRPTCPVCHESVYSRAGIHPQCAVVQSDPPKLRGKKKSDSANGEEVLEAPDPGAASGVPTLPAAERTVAADRAVILELASITRIPAKPAKSTVRSNLMRSVRLPT